MGHEMALTSSAFLPNAHDGTLMCGLYLCRIRSMAGPTLSHAATAVLQAVANGHQHGFDVSVSRVWRAAPSTRRFDDSKRLAGSNRVGKSIS